MQKKLLVICGPTATGKTKLALSLAKKFDGETVSADSRQVYKGLSIGTGKDIPENFEFFTSDLDIKGFDVGYFTDGKIRLWGYDLVEPTQEFSVSHYIRIARKIIKDIWRRKKLPILVGGTGLYLKAVINGIPTANIPKDASLRKKLSEKSAAELFDILKIVDSAKAKLLNKSDKGNPRRLIRAIEVAECKNKKRFVSMNQFIDTNYGISKALKVLFVGLSTPKELLYKKIEKRVDERVKKGVEKEVRKLLAEKVSWDSQAMQSLGYKEWLNYFKNGNSDTKQKKNVGIKNVIHKWMLAEQKYAKRQITWFKKRGKINWFDITKASWEKHVEKLVNKWHNK